MIDLLEYGLDPADYTFDSIVQRELDRGIKCGPWHQHWLKLRAPEKVRRYLELAALRPDLVAVTGNLVGTDVGSAFPAASTAAINTTTTETNLWNPGLAPMTIPAFTIQAGRAWRVEFGGVMGTTGTPAISFRMRCGTNNSAPPTGTDLGVGPTVTIGTFTAQPFFGVATMGARTVASPAASQAALAGTGVVFMAAAAAATATPHAVMGGALPTTVDQTVLQGLGVSVIWGTNSASNTLTCQYFGPLQIIG